MEPKKPTSARELRKKRTFIVEIRPDFIVEMKKLTMTDMVIQRLIPFNLLKAATKFGQLQEKADQIISKAGDDEGKQVQELTDLLDPKDLGETMEFLRHYAMAVIINPVLVPTEDGNEDHLPVDTLSYEDLQAIFYAVPPEVKEVPVVTPQQAEDFRRPEPGAPVDVVPPSEGVRTASKLVDSPEREYLHG